MAGGSHFSGMSKMGGDGTMMKKSIMSKLQKFDSKQLESLASNISFDPSEIELTDVQMKKIVEQKIEKNRIIYEQQLKNVKPIAKQIAVDFLKLQTEKIVKMLTSEHH